MIEFWHAMEWFTYGFIGGWVAEPAWQLIKRVRQEVKLAREEGSRPRG